MRRAEDRAAFAAYAPGRAHPLVLDVTDYAAILDPIRAARQAKSGNQPGDPAKAAQALLALVEAEH